MAIWVLLSILTALFLAIANIVDKFVFTRWVVKPIAPIIIMGIVGLAASIIVYLFKGFVELSAVNMIIGIMAGIFYCLSILFYFKGVKIEEISRIIPLYYLFNFFILALAFIFLDEVLTPVKYIGVFFLVIGAVLVSQKNSIDFKFNKAVGLMLIAAFFFAVNAILTKYLLGFADYWTIFAYTRGLGVTVALFPLIWLNFRELKGEIKNNSKKAMGILVISAILTMLGEFFIVIATSLGSVTLVNAMASVQPFFVLMFALFISKFYPGIFKEEIGRAHLVIKFVAIILVIIGVALIS